MDTRELVETIHSRYQYELGQLVTSLASPEARHGPDSGPDWRPAALGPVRSVTDPHANVTIGADVSDFAWFEEDLTASGDLTTMSLAAHHRQLRGRMSLNQVEADAWALAVLGAENAAVIYRAGALSGMGRFSTVYYHLYRDEWGEPAPLPAGSRVAEQAARLSPFLT